MITFVIKHVLPDGSTAGYHMDSGCSITGKKERAKQYNAVNEAEIQEQLKVTRKNFAFAWDDASTDLNGGERYRKLECWKGYPLDQIQTVAEKIN